MTRNATNTRAALIACGALLSLSPLTASALGITVVNVSSSGASTAVLENNEVLTIDLRLDNPTNLAVAGLGIGVTGYDNGNDGTLANDHLRFVGGSVASSVLNTSFDGTDYLGGIGNIRVAPVQIGTGAPVNNPRRVQLFDGISLAQTTGDGSIDPSITGDTTGPTGAHFRIQFRAAAGINGINNPTAVTLFFGVGQFGNVAVDELGNNVPFSNASYTVTVAPEPGTALLMGLGLAGLAARRRR